MKKIIAYLVTISMLVSVLPCTVFAASKTYNIDAALAYAANHWNDGKGLCAEFVSDCLTAGGVNVNITTTRTLRNFLVNNGYATDYLITKKQGTRVKMSDYPGKISKGDVIINYCIECNKYPHVMLVSGTNSSGQITYYAHNSAANGSKAYWNGSDGYPSHVGHTFEMHILHMHNAVFGGVVQPTASPSTPTPSTPSPTEKPTQTVQPVHVHSYDLQTQSSHPHNRYNVCECGTTESLGRSTKATCKDCYPVGSVSLKRSVEKTKGNVTFYRNNVTNANKYTLKLYRDGSLYDTYTMSSTELSEIGLPSGEYEAKLYAKNTNTGEERYGSCQDFKVVNTYNVSYNANGGSGAPSSQTKIEDETLTLSNTVPKREHYIFKGWAKSKNATKAQYQPGGKYTQNTKVTLYAVWEPEVYTVTYNLNGGEGEIADVKVIYGNKIQMPKNIIRQYHYLKGWSTNSNAREAEYKFDTDYQISADTTLYAVWGTSTWSGNVSQSLKGSGTAQDPYLISSEGDLAYLANKVNSQTSAPTYEYYKLTTNINLNYTDWTPVGVFDSSNQCFCGSFDGNGYTISDFYISDIYTCDIGLFGYVKNSEIKNLNITGAIESFTLNKVLKIGAIAGEADNTNITNCNVMNFNISGITASTSDYSYIGGLVGYAKSGKISKCNTKESYINLKAGKYEAGMIAGYSGADLVDCSVSAKSDGLFGTSTTVGAYNIGGLCGNLASKAKRCTVNALYLSNTLKTTAQTKIGGLTGVCSGNVEVCAVNFDDTSKEYTIDGEKYYSSILAEGNGVGYVGGMSGELKEGAKITDCKYNGQSLTDKTSNAHSYVGGITGYATAKANKTVNVSGNYEGTQKLNYFSLPQKSGYIATWYTDAALTNEYDFSEPLKSDITLYAKWEEGEMDIWDGTSSEPSYNAETKTYTITNGQELAWVSDVTNGIITSGTNFPTDKTFSGYTIRLTNDICLNDTTDFENWETTPPENKWKPISTFSGKFYGDNHSINGIYINEKINETGFIRICENATLLDIHIDKSLYIVDGIGNVACVVGGFVGEAENTNIYRCINSATIKGDCVGGIIGYQTEGEIYYCANFGLLYGASIGGIVNYLYESSVYYCWNTGLVDGASYVGGLVGDVEYSDIRYCYNSGRVYGDESVAGIAGNIVGTNIYRCYNTSRISASKYAGGIVGSSFVSTKGDDIKIKYCYNSGIIPYDRKGNNGGIVGMIRDYDTSADCKIIIKYCYDSGSSNDSYNITGSGDAILDIDYDDSLSISELKTLSELYGFSTSDWGINSSINDGYPYLKSLANTYNSYKVTTVAEQENVLINRSFANINGIIHSNTNYGAYAGGIIGYGAGTVNSLSTIQNVMTITDRISTVSSGSSYKANSGYLIGFNNLNRFDLTTNAYYGSGMDISAVNTATSSNTAINTEGTERSTATLHTSFYTTKLGLNPYVSVANVASDETAVWVLKNGELPELYYNCLNDITISEDIENGSVTVDKEQAVEGEKVTVTAVPAENYVLNKIYINGEEITDTQFEVKGDSKVYVTFAEKIPEYNVSITADENATGALTNVDNTAAMLMSVMALSDESETSLTANDGEEICVNTVADEDYTVDSIYVNGEEIAGDSFIVSQNSNVTMAVTSISTKLNALTNNAENIGVYSAVLSGSVEGSEGTSRYIRYWETALPSVVYTTEVHEGGGEYSVEVKELESNTEYSFQMTEYGEVKTFTTFADEESSEEFGEDEEIILPLTSTTYKKLTSTYKFSIESSMALETESLFIAIYREDDSLIAVKQVECDGDTSYTSSFPISTEIKYAKIFVWDNLKPLGGMEKVDIIN